jgi:hypothetical protein
MNTWQISMIALILLLHLHLHMITRLSNNAYSRSSPTSRITMTNPHGINVLFYILRTTPKSMSLTPSRTLTFFTTILGFPTSPAFGKFSRK